MFRSIARFFRAIGYLLTGKVDKATEKVASDPNVIRAQFDSILRAKKGQIQEYSGAVAQLLAQQEKKKATMKRLSGDIEKLSSRKAGAGGLARELAVKLKAEGKTSDEIKSDPDFLKHQSAFTDFSSTLGELVERVEEIDGDIKSYAERIAKHKIGLQNLQRDIAKLKDEQADTVADIITAKEERQINDALSGISSDGTGAELERIRDMRDKAKAAATISSELAGTDIRVAEQEYEAYASATASNDEFDALIGNLDEADDAKMERLENRLSKLSE